MIQPLSLPKFITNGSKTIHWALCFFWLAAMITLLFVYREFFWLALPGTVTYFAKAMDIM